MPVFEFGSRRVGNNAIELGRLYKDDRDKVAKAVEYIEGVVALDWPDSGKQSQCSEQQFRKRFHFYSYSVADARSCSHECRQSGSEVGL